MTRQPGSSDAIVPRSVHDQLIEMLADIRIAYFRSDATGRTVETSPEEQRLTGYSKRELIGMSRAALHTKPADRDHLLKLLRQEKVLNNYLAYLKRKDGTSFPVLADVRLFRDENGREWVEGIYRDATEWLRLRSFLDTDPVNAANEIQLVRLLMDKAQSNLDYVLAVGHQLITPLVNLKETVKQIKEGILEDAEIIGDRLDWAIGQARVSINLVRNFAYMAQILEGREIERQPVPIAQLAIRAKFDALQQLKRKDLTLAIDDASLDLHCKLEGSRALIRQVFVNLIDNAIKYSYPHTTIEIRAQRMGDHRCLDVSNQGIAIPEEARERIFERGFRLPQAKAAIPHGTGLGLWLVRRIVKAHGAAIQCLEESRDGVRRNLFRITFTS